MNCVICAARIVVPTTPVCFTCDCYISNRFCYTCSLDLLQLEKPKGKRYVDMGDGGLTRTCRCPLCNNSSVNLGKLDLFAIKVDKYSMELVDHLTTFTYECGRCDKLLETQEKAYLHIMKECPKITVQCSSKGCKFYSFRENINEHFKKCPHRRITCPMCTSELFYMKSLEHLNKCISSQEEKIKKAKDILAELLTELQK